MLVSISVFKHVVESSLGTASIFCCPEGEFCFFFSFLDFFFSNVSIDFIKKKVRKFEQHVVELKDNLT